jgi:hypothetical protein
MMPCPLLEMGQRAQAADHAVFVKSIAPVSAAIIGMALAVDFSLA